MPRAGLIQLEAEGISRDPEVVQAYISDPLVFNGKTTARLAAEMLRAMQRVTNEAGRINLPVLLLQGADDRMIESSGAQLLYDSIGSENKEIKIYDGLYHEVFNEPERERVLGDVEAWLLFQK